MKIKVGELREFMNDKAFQDANLKNNWYIDDIDVIDPLFDEDLNCKFPDDDIINPDDYLVLVNDDVDSSGKISVLIRRWQTTKTHFTYEVKVLKNKEQEFLDAMLALNLKPKKD